MLPQGWHEVQGFAPCAPALRVGHMRRLSLTVRGGRGPSHLSRGPADRPLPQGERAESVHVDDLCRHDRGQAFARPRSGRLVRYTTRFSAIAVSTDCTPGIRITTPRRNASNAVRSAATMRIR